VNIIFSRRGVFSIFVKLILYYGLMAACCLGACIAPFTLPELFNDWQLQRFASHLYEYPLPLQTTRVARHSSVGIEGNGNHCDFRASQDMVTKLSRAEITAYYRDVELPPVNNYNVGLAPWARGRPIPVWVDFGPDAGTGSISVTVTLFDGGYGDGFDWRCG
jgi:hypothetical protein